MHIFDYPCYLALLLYMVYCILFSFFSSTITNLVIVKCQTKAYLTLLELGMVLGVVRDDYPSEYKYTFFYWFTLCFLGPVLSKRPFSDKVLKIGEPNLVVTPPGEHYSTCTHLTILATLTHRQCYQDHTSPVHGGW